MRFVNNSTGSEVDESIGEEVLIGIINLIDINVMAALVLREPQPPEPLAGVAARLPSCRIIVESQKCSRDSLGGCYSYCYWSELRAAVMKLSLVLD